MTTTAPALPDTDPTDRPRPLFDALSATLDPDGLITVYGQTDGVDVPAPVAVFAPAEALWVASLITNLARRAQYANAMAGVTA